MPPSVSEEVIAESNLDNMQMKEKPEGDWYDDNGWKILRKDMEISLQHGDLPGSDRNIACKDGRQAATESSTRNKMKHLPEQCQGTFVPTEPLEGLQTPRHGEEWSKECIQDTQITTEQSERCLLETEEEGRDKIGLLGSKRCERGGIQSGNVCGDEDEHSDSYLSVPGEEGQYKVGLVGRESCEANGIQTTRAVGNEEGSFRCPICQSVFFSPHLLEIHMAFHKQHARSDNLSEIDKVAHTGGSQTVQRRVTQIDMIKAPASINSLSSTSVSMPDCSSFNDDFDRFNTNSNITDTDDVLAVENSEVSSLLSFIDELSLPVHSTRYPEVPSMDNPHGGHLNVTGLHPELSLKGPVTAKNNELPSSGHPYTSLQEGAPEADVSSNHTWTEGIQPEETAKEHMHIQNSPVEHSQENFLPDDHLSPCYICPSKFGNVRDLDEHLKDIHGEDGVVTSYAATLGEGHTCGVCGNCFGSVKDIQKHMESHSENNDGLFAQTEQPSPAKYKKAISDIAGERQFRCEVCSKGFLRNAHLQRHMLIHRAIKPFSCDQCRRAFSDNSSLRRHEQVVHNTAYPYLCNNCGMDFRSKRSLGAHKRSRSCHESTLQIPSLDEAGTPTPSKAHQQTSSRNRTLQKQTITPNKTLTVKIKKLRDKVSHSEDHGGVDAQTKQPSPVKCRKAVSDIPGDRQFRCEVCPKGFHRNAHLQRHMLIHRAIKPFACDQCRRAFNDDSSLRRHQKLVHNITKQYLCNICGVKFLSKGSLGAHKRSRSCHGVTHQIPSLDEAGHLTPLADQQTSFSLQQSSEQNVKGFVCQYCPKMFSAKSDLEAHIRTHRAGNIHYCKICGKFFTTHAYLKRHMRVHNGKKPCSCDLCGRAFNDFSSCKRHMRRHNKKPSIGVKGATQRHQITGRTRRKVAEEKSKTSNEKTKGVIIIRNKTLQIKTETLEDQESHFERHPSPKCRKAISDITGDRQFQCEVCAKKFHCNTHLQRHLLIHRAVKPFSCPQCLRAFADDSSLRRHKKLVHNETNLLLCNNCGVIFRCTRSLAAHNRSRSCHAAMHHKTSSTKRTSRNPLSARQQFSFNHPQASKPIKKEFVCDFCNGCFSKKGDLDEHILQHASSNNHSNNDVCCAICKKAFRSKYYVRRHMVVHTGAKPFTCDVCNRAFNYVSSLNRHSRHCNQHNSKKKDGLVIISSKALDVDQMAITGEGPSRSCDYVHSPIKDEKTKAGKSVNSALDQLHICQVCSKVFSTVADLKTHMVTHKVGKIFTCPTCGKLCKKKHHLVRHVRIHTGEKPYSCRFCGQAFNDVSSYTRHMRLKHANNPKQKTKTNKEAKHKDEKSEVEIQAGQKTSSKIAYCTDLREQNNKSLEMKTRIQDTRTEVDTEDKYDEMHVQGVVMTEESSQATDSSAKQEVYSCQVCSRVYCTAADFKTHMVTHKVGVNFLCPICGKLCKKKHHLVRHVRIHTGEKPYSCRVCGQAFNDVSSYTRHMRLKHTNNPKQKTKTNKEAQHKDEKSEVEIETEQKTFSEIAYCTDQETEDAVIVGNEKVAQTLLEADQAIIRTDASSHPYSETDEFSLEKYLGEQKNKPLEMKTRIQDTRTEVNDTEDKYEEMHVQGVVMTEESSQAKDSSAKQESYSCQVCSRVYCTAVDLKTHMVTHEVKPNLTCPMCGKVFKRKNHLVRHVRIHTGEKPYSCMVCGQAYSDVSSYNRHMRLKH